MMFEVHGFDCKACQSFSCRCLLSSNMQRNWYAVAKLDPEGKKAIDTGTTEALMQYLKGLEDEVIAKGLKREFGDERRSYRVFVRNSTAVAGSSVIGDGIRLGPWINEDHCSMRCIEGTDPEVIANRVAFIEKTPRVRVARAVDPFEDWKGWHEGEKGCGHECGQYAPSREWCDEQLKLLGYEFI